MNDLYNTYPLVWDEPLRPQKANAAKLQKRVKIKNRPRDPGLVKKQYLNF